MAKDRVRVGDTANWRERRPPRWQYVLSVLAGVLAIGVVWQFSAGDDEDRPPSATSTSAVSAVPPQTSSVPQTEPGIDLDTPHCERVTGESIP